METIMTGDGETAYIKSSVDGNDKGSLSRQIRVLEGNIMELDARLAKLVEMLQPVLTDSYPSPGEVAQDRPNLPQFAYQIYVANEKLDEMGNVLANIMGRLDL